MCDEEQQTPGDEELLVPDVQRHRCRKVALGAEAWWTQ
jgi:hypothetical protein